MTYDHNFFETYKSPKRFNLIMRALFAGWGASAPDCDFIMRTLVLAKPGKEPGSVFYLSMPAETYFEIGEKSELSEKRPTRGVLAHVHYRNLRFDHKNPFKIVKITYKSAPQEWDFDLQNPHLGLIEGAKCKVDAAWMDKIRKILIDFWELHRRPPAKYEFLGFLMQKMQYNSPMELLRLLNLGLGTHWAVQFEHHKTNPKARRCYYYYPISQ